MSTTTASKTFTPTSNYTLNAGEVSHEAKRLSFQHDIFLRMTDTLLPPEISNHLSTISAPKIADVATGTGIWSRSIAKLYPTAELDGYDFDTSKFPSEISNNVTLSFANVIDIDSFPKEKIGTYDLVHVRLLCYGLKKDEWPIGAKNLEKLLKPGGWLMWEETGYPSWVTLPPAKSWYRILENDIRFAQQIGRDIIFPLTLESYISSAGFRDLKIKNHNSLILERQDDVKEALILVLGQAIHGIAERGGFGEIQSKADADKMVADLREELLGEGSEEQMAAFELKWVWGRKDE